MRSDLIFGALTQVPGRFQLTRLAAYATRKFHRPNARIQDTTNDVLVRSAGAAQSQSGKTTRKSPQFHCAAQAEREV